MSRRRTGSASTLGLLVVALLVLAIYLATDRPGPTSYSPPADGGEVPAGTLDPAAASAALGTLPIAAKGGLAGYERDCGDGAGCVFGPAWSDVDRNGCDQRNDVLHRDLTDVEVREGTEGCIVVAGTLVDPYTGEVVAFSRDEASQVPIDHVVPLAAAWVQGAAAWTDDEREAFANDLSNLIATTREQNSSKGDSTAEEWVPPDPSYGCEYASVVVTVKAEYELSVTAAEAAALRDLLATC
ncbi:HNH endonuclease family protein [Geodermatophilus sp. SYSU D00691]